MTDWADLNARARGLSTHLLGRAALERLAGSPDPVALARALDSIWSGEEPTPRHIGGPERVVRRTTADRMSLLARWAGPRVEPLEVVFADEERRSVRSLVRGALQGAPPRERLRGLVPTPGLGVTALEAAAGRRSIEGVIETLEERGHPWGPGLLARIDSGPFDLFQLELEIDRIHARRIRAAARGGDDRLRHHVGRTIDLQNAWTLLLAGSFLAETDADDTWIEGGEALGQARFEAILAEPDGEARRERLADVFSGAPLGRLFGDPSIPGSKLEPAALGARIAEARRAALHAPLSTAPILLYALRLRAQAVDLGRVAWGVALGAPRPAVSNELVTAR